GRRGRGGRHGLWRDRAQEVIRTFIVNFTRWRRILGGGERAVDWGEQRSRLDQSAPPTFYLGNSRGLWSSRAGIGLTLRGVQRLVGTEHNPGLGAPIKRRIARSLSRAGDGG